MWLKTLIISRIRLGDSSILHAKQMQAMETMSNGIRTKLLA